jgi:Phytanoyl-CoA dioxygenase (PhyH)
MAPELGAISHTNDDLAAVGIMLDDCEMENGPMMVIPGSHQRAIYDRHGPDGRFCGAIDPARCDLDFSRAVPCLGKAGSITVHHTRAVAARRPTFPVRNGGSCCSSTVLQTPSRRSASRTESRSSILCCSPAARR